MRRIISIVGLAALLGVLVASATAGTITGTPRNDTLRGTAKADTISGGAGNDRIFGLAGNDRLNGGPGNDVISGGPGADVITCGVGRDTVAADVADKIAADCEIVQGLPKPAMSVADASLTEGNTGSQPLSFTVTLAKASRLPVTVSYATADGTATAGTDYTAASGKLAFVPGQTSKTIAVSILADTAVESDESFTLTLSSPVNAQLGQATATGTIKNDDVAPKSGHYAGTTSQGKPIGFDVAADLKTLTNVSLVSDLTCTEVPVTLRNLSVTLPMTFPVAADWSFTASASNSDADGSISVAVNGKLAPPGTAAGTLRVDFTVNTDSGAVHCSTGDVTWTAS